MAVLQRKELEASPLADLHAIASELGLEGFRRMRKPDLIGAILGTVIFLLVQHVASGMVYFVARVATP